MVTLGQKISREVYCGTSARASRVHLTHATCADGRKDFVGAEFVAYSGYELIRTLGVCCAKAVGAAKRENATAKPDTL